MNGTFLISVLEPAAKGTQRQAAEIFSRKEKEATPDLEAIKARLKEIREYSSANQPSLVTQFQESVSRHPGVKATVAENAAQAINYINEVAGETKLVSINKSTVITNELRPGLENAGFRVYIRYFKEFKDFEKVIQDYWQLPDLSPKGLGQSFEIATTIAPPEATEVRNYVAVLGVNAASAEDGQIFFLQHFSNIAEDLKEAKKVILVVAIDKIVKNWGDAAFQTKCNGTFGLESMALDLEPNIAEQYDFEKLPPLPDDQAREFHVLILDNGRSTLLSDGYKDLLLCLGCRACARQCPIGHYFKGDGKVWSPKSYLWSFLLGTNPSIEVCIHCGRCYVECPVDIDLPTLMWRAQFEHYAKHGRTLKKRLLDYPELLAKLGSWADPVSNWAMAKPVFRRLIETVAGIHRKAHMPTFHRESFKKWASKRKK